VVRFGCAEEHAGRGHRQGQQGNERGSRRPKSQERFADLGASLLPGSPADFSRLVADETEKWGKVVKFSGAKPD
jgi:hypothetical protein